MNLNLMKAAALTLLALSITSCATQKQNKVPVRTSDSLLNKIVMAKIPPPKYYKNIGNITGTSRSECGSYDAKVLAMIDLKEKALALHGEYVQYNDADLICDSNGSKLNASVYIKNAELETLENHNDFVLAGIKSDAIEKSAAETLKQQHTLKCKELGFKSETEPMSFCLLKQQELQASKDQQELQHETSVRTTAASKINEDQKILNERAAVESARDYSQNLDKVNAAILIQNSIMKTMTPPPRSAMKTINCNTYGSNVRCTEY